MNIKEIKEMISLMNDNNLMELEIEKDGTRIRLKKGHLGQFEVSSSEPGGGATKEIIETRKTEAAAAESRLKPDKELIEIKAPMVGTFYRAANPESPSYIEIGQNISVGQVVCIIEAMKLMNEIKSEYKGKIIEVIVNNAEPVEYGQVIIKLEPSA